jgi:hypothetical protein
MPNPSHLVHCRHDICNCEYPQNLALPCSHLVADIIDMQGYFAIIALSILVWRVFVSDPCALHGSVRMLGSTMLRPNMLHTGLEREM